MTSPFPATELVSVRRTVTSDTAQTTSQKLARMIITGEGVNTPPILIPYAPRAVNHTDLGGLYNQINRPGLPDIVAYRSPGLPRMSFSLFVADRYSGVASGTTPALTTAVSIAKVLQQYSDNGTRVRITYGTLESGLWYIEELSIDTIERDPVSDETTRANIDITFVRASDVVEGLGPLTGGAQRPSQPSAQPAQQTGSRYYTVKSGDTLWAISIKFYGTGERWREIADANGVTDPRLLMPNTVLRIP